MSSTIDISIPDIGDAENVEVIELLVSVGDTVSVDDSLLTVESDKASMEIPAEQAGSIASLNVKVGDQVNTGDIVGQLELAAASATDGALSAANAPATAEAPDAANNAPAPQPELEIPPPAENTPSLVKVQVPDIGDSADVEVIEILVSVGDEVSEEQSLLTLESDKASMEIPSPGSGVVKSINVSLGDHVSMGTPLLDLESTANSQSDSDIAAADASSASNSAPASATTPAQHQIQANESASTPTAQAGSSASSTTTTVTTAPHSPTAHIPDSSFKNAHASPGVRRYARVHGADLSLIKGTGPKQRILKEDVIAFIKQSLDGLQSSYGVSTHAAAGSGIPAIPAIDFSKFGDIERVELGRINKLSATNLHRAWLNLPMVTHHDEADITEMEAFRKDLKKEAKEGEPKITGLAFHMKALAKTLKAFPKVNSSLSPEGDALFYKKYFHIGIAVDTPNGLVVPVFRDVDKKSVAELAEEMDDVSRRARDKKLKPDEMQGASMTISSIGGIGGSAFTPIVNPPEVAILGISRARIQPVWNGESFVPRLMCPLDLTYDHRVVDGADAARFMVHYVQLVSDMRRLIL